MTELYRKAGREVNSRFCLMKIPLLYWSDSAGERSGGARKVPYRVARSRSERAAPSAGVGKRFGLCEANRPDDPAQCAGAGAERDPMTSELN